MCILTISRAFTIQNVSIKFTLKSIFDHRFQEFTIQNVSIKFLTHTNGGLPLDYLQYKMFLLNSARR